VGGKTKKASERELPEVLKAALKMSRRHGKRTILQICQELDVKTEQVKALRKALGFCVQVALDWEQLLHTNHCRLSWLGQSLDEVAGDTCQCGGDRRIAFVQAALADKRYCR